MNSNRRKFLGAALAGMTSLSGCLGGILRSREAAASMSTMTDGPVVGGQATIEDGVPAVWGTVIADPAVARERVEWGKLTPLEGDEGPGKEFRTFERGDQCVTIVVGVLRKGFGLKGHRDSYFEDGTLHMEVEPYRAYVPDSDTPKYHYDYTFTLWNLNGLSVPKDVAVELHDAATETENRQPKTESTETT